MFCHQCGANNDEKALFCNHCDAQLTQSDPVETEISVEPQIEEMNIQKPFRRKPSKKSMWIGIFAGAGVACVAAVVCIALVLLVGSFFNTPRSVARSYMRSATNTNTTQYMKLIPKKVLRRYYFELYTDKNAVKTSDARMDAMKENMNDEFFIWHMFYFIEEVENVPSSNFAQLQEEYKELYHCNINGAKRVSVKVVVFHDFETTTETYNISLVRIGTKWYLDRTPSPESLLSAIFYASITDAS